MATRGCQGEVGPTEGGTEEPRFAGVGMLVLTQEGNRFVGNYFILNFALWDGSNTCLAGAFHQTIASQPQWFPLMSRAAG